MIAQIQEQLIRDSTATTGLTIHETYLIIGISAMAIALVYMYFDLRKTNRHHSDEQKDANEKMTVAMNNSTNAIQGNTKVLERLTDKIDSIKTIQKKG